MENEKEKRGSKGEISVAATKAPSGRRGHLKLKEGRNKSRGRKGSNFTTLGRSKEEGEKKR